MNRLQSVVLTVGAVVMLTSSVAIADDNSLADQVPGDTSFVRGRGYKIIPDPDPVEAVQHFSNVLFLNRCAGGCNVSFGTDNSSQNRSSIASGHLDEFRWSDTVWNEVVACVQDVFSPFNVVVTDDDPGAAEHMEAMVAGLACDVSNDPQCQYILGFAPFVCSYGYIPRSISFTFANANYYGSGTQTRNVNELCATIAQEAAHTWGLDHEILASDPMTYAPYNGRRQFANQLVQCGEDINNQHSCGCSSTQQQQNSVQRIGDRFGFGSPTPPNMTIVEPADGAQVDPGFLIVAEGNETLQRVELYIDSVMISSDNSAPYEWNAPDDLVDGSHRVEVRGYDAQGTPGTEFVNVIIGEPCETPGDCQDVGENYTCVGGRCVPGEGTPGGLGEPCAGDEECFSGLCLSNGSEMRCVESCTPEGDDCPDGFDCLGYDGGGACWPGTGGGGGGCSSSEDTNSALPIGVGLAFLGVVIGRRRRRAKA